ncbi:MAG TPA: hypothetical protein PLD93_03795, partial [Synergistaceae bacterium]|nr:hypothetical protein [Synergistaceae bacterium]
MQDEITFSFSEIQLKFALFPLGVRDDLLYFLQDDSITGDPYPDLRIERSSELRDSVYEVKKHVAG